MAATTRFNYEELDKRTQQYLHSVWKTQGRGVPGVYAPMSDAWPWIGLIVGVILIGVTLFFTWAPLEHPTQVTFLQTAGILAGGWMVIAAFRIWFGRNVNQVGHFLYADPERLWSVTGGKLEVTPLDGLTAVTAHENYNNEGVYQNTDIQLFFADRVRSVQIGSLPAASRIVLYLQALTLLPLDSPEWSSLTPTERGHRAREAAGELDELRAEETGLAIPPPPQRVGGGAGRLLLALALSAAVGAGIFFLLHPVNLAARDHAIFALVKHGKAPDLRLYLLDERNTRYREQVKDLLRTKHYLPRFETLRTAAQDKELGEGLITLVDTISTAVMPIVTLRVKNETKDLAVDDPNKYTAVESVQKLIAGQLGKAVGEELILFAHAPEGKPALLEWSFQWAPTADKGKYAMKWTVAFRKKFDEEPYLPREMSGPEGVDLAGIPLATHAEVQRFLELLAGPIPPPQVNNPWLR